MNYFDTHMAKNPGSGTSLVAQWIRIHLPVQGTQAHPWSGKIPHFLEQLSLCATVTEVQAPQSPKATTTERTCCNYGCLRAWSLCSETREATAVRRLCSITKSSPRCSRQLEKVQAKQRMGIFPSSFQIPCNLGGLHITNRLLT